MARARPSPDDDAATAGTIEVFVRSLDQLFQSTDPTPFREEGFDPEAEDLVLCRAWEMPRAAIPTVVVHLEAPPGLPDEESTLRDAIRSHFARRSQRSKAELRQLLRRGWRSLAVGLCFLSVALVGSGLVARLVHPQPLSELLRESLVVGGWIVMWGPAEIFLYAWWPIRGRRRLFDRLTRLDVRIVYTGGDKRSGARELRPRIASMTAPGRWGRGRLPGRHPRDPLSVRPRQ